MASSSIVTALFGALPASVLATSQFGLFACWLFLRIIFFCTVSFYAAVASTRGLIELPAPLLDLLHSRTVFFLFLVFLSLLLCIFGTESLFGCHGSCLSENWLLVHVMLMSFDLKLPCLLQSSLFVRLPISVLLLL